MKSNVQRHKKTIEGGGVIAREEGIECFSSFMMDILNMRERHEAKQYLGIFTAGVTEKNTQVGFLFFSFMESNYW